VFIGLVWAGGERNPAPGPGQCPAEFHATAFEIGVFQQILKRLGFWTDVLSSDFNLIFRREIFHSLHFFFHFPTNVQFLIYP
jgi:hypothetical protein